ncbi:MAG: sterol desaturase family protein [Deltaproteobacteria bacterium]|nr:MAG: sterol desaturase family protein [Deltaproteobacteria bacterium]
MTALLSAALTLAFLAAVFVPLERLFPRNAQPVWRPESRLDLLFFGMQQTVWRAAALAALAAIAAALDGVVPPDLRATVASWPLAVQIAVVVLLCDLVVYWGHRLSHRVPLLWRFHRVHHTAEHLDFLAAYREHPVDGLWTMTLENLPALVLGFPLELIAGFVAFRGVWAVFIHSNTRLPLGPLRVLLGAPELHHWHHDAGVGGTKNFANLSPLMDVLFGTYYAPNAGAPRLGCAEPTPRSYLGQLAWPFVEPLRSGRPTPTAEGDGPVDPTEIPVVACENADGASVRDHRPRGDAGPTPPPLPPRRAALPDTARARPVSSRP